MNKINNKYQMTPTNQKAGLRDGSQQPNTWRRECEGEGLLSFPCGKLCHLIVMLPIKRHTQQRGFVINAADLGKRFILKSQGGSWLVDMGSKVVELLERRFNDKYSHRLEVFSPRLFPSNCPSWPAVAFNVCLELY